MRHNRQNLLWALAAAAIVAPLVTAPCLADDEPKKERRGMVGVLSDKEYDDMSPEELDAMRRSRRSDAPDRRDINIGALPEFDLDLEGRREEVERLSGVDFSEATPVTERDAALADMERLRARRAELADDLDRADRAADRDSARRGEAFNDRWRPASEAVKDGADSGNLRKAVNGALKDGASPENRPLGQPGRVDPPRGSALRDEVLEAAGLNTDRDHGKGPNHSPTKTPTGRMSDEIAALADKIAKGEQPSGISEVDWARLGDTFDRDRADLAASDAESVGDRRSRRSMRLSPMDEALHRAKEFVDRLAETDDTLSEEDRRFIEKTVAWRLHQERLAAERRRLKKAEALERERNGEVTGRMDDVIGKGLSGGYDKARKAIDNVSRQMDLGGHGQPPESPALYEDGLKFPEWTGTLGYKDRIEAKLRYLRAELSRLEAKVEKAERSVQRRDALRLRMRQFELESADRLRLRLSDPSATELRRKKLLELAKELLDSRPDRIGELTDKYRPRIEYLRVQVADEMKRLSEIEPDPVDPPAEEPGPVDAESP